MNKKHVRDSRTEHVQILTQSTLNGYKRLFGGRLMEWIDITAAVVARRHSEKNVTTAYIDSLSFEAPAYANDTVVLNGYITYVGKTSMEICVKTFIEKLNGNHKLINTAYIIMVALDENDNPTPVPGLILETDDEQEEWKRAELRKKIRIEKINSNS